jgi:hypothetical protein
VQFLVFVATVLGIGLAVLLDGQDRRLRCVSIVLAVFLTFYSLGDAPGEALLRCAVLGFWIVQFGFVLLSLQSRRTERLPKSTIPKTRRRQELPICLDVEALLAMPIVPRVHAIESCFRDIAINLLAAQDLSFTARLRLSDISKRLRERSELLPGIEAYAILEQEKSPSFDHPYDTAYPLLVDAWRTSSNLVEDLLEQEQDWERIMQERGELLTGLTRLLSKPCAFERNEEFVRHVALLWRSAQKAVAKVQSICAQVRELGHMIPDIDEEIKCAQALH